MGLDAILVLALVGVILALLVSEKASIDAIGDTPSQHFHKFGETIKAIVPLADVVHLDA